MDRFVRLMIVKERSGWGYETLVREVSDSLHLRRFCLIALAERVPDESTVRKLVRRLGPEVIEEICRALIAQRDDGQGALRRPGGRGSTRRWSRPTCATRPTLALPRTRPTTLAREAARVAPPGR